MRKNTTGNAEGFGPRDTYFTFGNTFGNATEPFEKCSATLSERLSGYSECSSMEQWIDLRCGGGIRKAEFGSPQYRIIYLGDYIDYMKDTYIIMKPSLYTTK